jgi:hypothetical protein
MNQNYKSEEHRKRLEAQHVKLNAMSKDIIERLEKRIEKLKRDKVAMSLLEKYENKSP